MELLSLHKELHLRIISACRSFLLKRNLSAGDIGIVLLNDDNVNGWGTGPYLQIRIPHWCAKSEQDLSNMDDFIRSVGSAFVASMRGFLFCFATFVEVSGDGEFCSFAAIRKKETGNKSD